MPLFLLTIILILVSPSDTISTTPLHTSRQLANTSSSPASYFELPPQPYESVPVIVVAGAWLASSRKHITVALARRSQVRARRYDPTVPRDIKPVIVVLSDDVPKSFREEVYNTENLIVISIDGGGTRTRHESMTTVLLMGFQIAARILPNTCLLLLHPLDVRLGRIVGVADDTDYSSYNSITDFDCRAMPPARFAPDVFSLTNVDAMFSLLLPPLASYTDESSSSSSWPTRQTLDFLNPASYTSLVFFFRSTTLWQHLDHASIITLDRTFYKNSLECYKNHVRRTPQRTRRVQGRFRPTLTRRQSTSALCLAVPIRGHPTTLLNATIPGFMATLATDTVLTTIRLYIAWEGHDQFLSIQSNRAIFVDALNNIVTRYNRTGIDVDLIIRGFPNVEFDLVYLWNMLFLEAFEDGCDWYMHITDDVQFETTPGAGYGWHDRFIQLLQANGNFGLIGSKKVLNTMPFVHRTHLEMMSGWFYSRMVHNVMCDTSLWNLYRAINLLVGPKDLGHWINLSDNMDTQYARRYPDCHIDQFYEQDLESYGPPQYYDLSLWILNRFTLERMNQTYTRAPTSMLKLNKVSIKDPMAHHHCLIANAIMPSLELDC